MIRRTAARSAPAPVTSGQRGRGTRASWSASTTPERLLVAHRDHRTDVASAALLELVLHPGPGLLRGPGGGVQLRGHLDTARGQSVAQPLARRRRCRVSTVEPFTTRAVADRSSSPATASATAIPTDGPVVGDVEVGPGEEPVERHDGHRAGRGTSSSPWSAVSASTTTTSAPSSSAALERPGRRCRSLWIRTSQSGQRRSTRSRNAGAARFADQGRRCASGARTEITVRSAGSWHAGEREAGEQRGEPDAGHPRHPVHAGHGATAPPAEPGPLRR